MNTEYFFILTSLFGLLILLIQRTEARRRLGVSLLTLVPAVLIRNFAVYRDVETEAWVALGTALILNFLFWVLIGRYNPVGSSDAIKVLGMDD